MLSWYNDNSSIYYHVYQLVSICLSVVIISKSCTDHYFFEVSGKAVRGIIFSNYNIVVYHILYLERSPSSQFYLRMLLNISNIMCRVILLAMLATYLQYFCLIFIGMMIVCNFIISGFIIKTDGSKHFWTAFSSVLLPNAFISRDTVIILGRRKTRDIFQKFFKANSVLFLLLICVGGYITTNCLITFTDIIHYNCNNVPLLSYKQVYSL